MSKLYTCREIGAMLNVHWGTVKSWVNNGWLKAHSTGEFGKRSKYMLISEEDLNEFISSRPNYQRLVCMTKPSVIEVPVVVKTDVDDLNELYASCLAIRDEMDKMIDKIRKLL